MKKKKYGLVIGCGVLVVLGAVYVGVGAYMDRSQAAKTAKEEAEKIYMTDFSDITSVSYDNDGEELSFTKNGDTWKYDGDDLFPVNNSKMEEIADTVKKLPAIRKLDGGDGLQAYGLDQPQRKVTVTDSGKNQQTILIGQATDSGDYYAAVEGQNIPYLISSSLFDETSYALNDMIQLEQFPAVSGANIKTITVEKDGITKHYVKKELDGNGTANDQGTAADNGTTGDNGTAANQGTTAWYLGSADSESNRLPDNSVLDTLADSLTGLTVKSCTNYKVTDAELPAYGLDHPTAVLSYTYDKDGKDETFTLQVGKATEDDNNYYTRTQGSNFVNEVDKADLNKCLEADPEASVNPADTETEAGVNTETETGSNAGTEAGSNAETEAGANAETETGSVS